VAKKNTRNLKNENKILKMLSLKLKKNLKEKYYQKCGVVRVFENKKHLQEMKI